LEATEASPFCPISGSVGRGGDDWRADLLIC
jgi:hypothetical protein